MTEEYQCSASMRFPHFYAHSIYYATQKNINQKCIKSNMKTFADKIFIQQMKIYK